MSDKPREPDGIIRYPVAGWDDPDRQIALRITNFLAGREARQAVAIYSLAITMSLRDCDPGFQRAAILGISEACLKSWEIGRGEREPPLCEACAGAGTVGCELNARSCEACKGTGHL